MNEEDIAKIQKKFSHLFYFFEYACVNGLDQGYINEFTPEVNDKIKNWNFSKKILSLSFYINLEHVFADGNFVTQYDTAVANKRDKHYFIGLQQKIDNDFLQYCKKLNTKELEAFTLFNPENIFVSNTAFFELYFSSLPAFKRTKFSYIVENNKKSLVNKVGGSAKMRDFPVDLYRLFSEETKLFENIFDNRISDYLVSNYISTEFSLEKPAFDYNSITFESDPVFKLFFKSKASFEIFKETILPEKGKKITKPELKQIFEFYQDNKLKHQLNNFFTPTPMSATSDQSSFIRAINPFFEVNYDENMRIDNASISSKKQYPVYERLQENYKIIKEKSREINHP